MSEQTSVLDVPFDTENEEGTKFDLVTPGKYTAEIEDAKVVVTKNGNGQMVKLRWKITEGDFEGRVLFQQIIIQHSTSPDAQKIGRQKFKDIASACDIKDKITDLEVLKFKPCTIDVGIEKGEGEYGDQNRVRYVKPFVQNWNGGDRAQAKPVKATNGGNEPNDAVPF
jgi:Protein of unknown function (DUF669)